MKPEVILFVFLGFLTVAIVFGLLAVRLRQPVVMGYLVAGLILGPIAPALSIDPNLIQAFADFGVTFLMFSLGIQFSFSELVELRKIVLRGGTLQIILTIGLGVLFFWILGMNPRAAFLLAALSSLCSSSVAFTLLESRGGLAQPAARPVIGLALAQDVAVIPLVALLPALAGSGSWDVAFGLLRSLAIGILTILIIAVLGFRIVPKILLHIARIGSRELFILAIVVLTIGTALGTDAAGLSLALGAFLAGIVISESDFSHQVLGGVLPLRDVFGVMFFAGLGFLVHPITLIQNWQMVLAILLIVVVAKGLVVASIVTVLGYSPRVSLRAGAFHAQIGEFSFVLAVLALQIGIIDQTLYNAIIGAAMASLLLNTLLLSLTERFGWLLEPPLLWIARPPLLQEAPSSSPNPPLRGHVVIAGYGRAGREVGRVLSRRRFRFVVIERDPILVRELRNEGIETVYGDVANEQVLLAAGIPTARVFVVAVPDALAAEIAVRYARALSPTLDIIARANQRTLFRRLIEAGANEAVHPSFEAGLEMVRHTLHRLGMSLQEIQAIITARRIDYYEEERVSE